MMISDTLQNKWKRSAKKIADKEIGKCPLSKASLTRTLSTLLDDIPDSVSDYTFVDSDSRDAILDSLKETINVGSTVQTRCAKSLANAYLSYINTLDF